MKKLIAILLTGAIALTFTACNNNNNDNNNNNGSADNNNGNNSQSVEKPSTPTTTLPSISENPVSDFDIIQFGGNDWIVLEESSGKSLVLSLEIIEERQYHADGGDITWEHSSIRNYLNGEYYNTFTADEQSRIVETTVINSDNPKYGTAGGNNTTDKIFLLSIDEANSYFSGDSSRIAYNANGEVSWWWFRSPGNNSTYAAYVDYDGNVNVYGLNVILNGGVRPALWLNL